jgi:hypothetical protein
MKKMYTIVGMLILCGTFYAGRKSIQFNTSDKVETTKTTGVQTDHTETTIVKVKDSKGNETETTKIISDTKSKTKENTTVAETTKTVAPSKSKVNVSALVGYDTAKRDYLYGISVTKEVMGPITVGAFGLNNGVVGVSLGYNF